MNIIIADRIQAVLTVRHNIHIGRLINGIASEQGKLNKKDKGSKETSDITYKPGSKNVEEKFRLVDTNKQVFEGGSKASTPGLAFWTWASLMSKVLDFAKDQHIEVPESQISWAKKFQMTEEERKALNLEPFNA